MINVLLVEDEAPKRAKIIKFISDLNLDVSISEAKSVDSAFDQIEVLPPDVLLLDMSLPTFDISERENGGDPLGFGGIEVLRFMELSEVSCPTIVITGYEAFPREAEKAVDLNDLREELEKDFPNSFKDIVHYDTSNTSWKLKIQDFFYNNYPNDTEDHE